MNKPTLAWMKQLGTFGEDAIKALALDNDGFIYVAGYTTGELVEGHRKGMRDAYLAKFDQEGNRVWQRQFGTVGYDVANAIVTDSEGGIYVAGHTSGELAKGQHKGGIDAFVFKYDGNGNLEWQRQLGTKGHDEAFALATDAHNNVFVAGYVTGELVVGQHMGEQDAFLSKFDSEGALLWQRQMGTPTSDIATALTTDPMGNVYIAGHTKGEWVPGELQGGRDAFLEKYDANGNHIWEIQVGTASYDAATALTSDQEGNIFLTLNTSGELIEGQHKGERDAYLAKFANDGTRLWDKQIGTASHDEVAAVTTDAEGSVFIAGQTQGELVEGEQKGGLDAYLAKYDSDGNRKWQIQIGSTGFDYATSLSSDKNGNLYIAGNTDGAMVPSQQNGGWDTFLAKYIDGDK